MKALCTTCCAEKRRDPGLLPAVERYAHPRIAWCAAEAARRGQPLFILSGMLGLIDGATPIPWYDKRLEEGEVAELVPFIAATLRREGLTGLELVARPESTPGWGPYHRLLREAAALAGVELRLSPWPPQEPAG